MKTLNRWRTGDYSQMRAAKQAFICSLSEDNDLLSATKKRTKDHAYISLLRAEYLPKMVKKCKIRLGADVKDTNVVQYSSAVPYRAWIDVFDIPMVECNCPDCVHVC